MQDPTQLPSRPPLGANRPTLLFVVWLFIGLSVTGVGVIDFLNRGFADAWLLLFGGGMLLVYVVWDWLTHRGGDFVRRSDDRRFLLLTAFVLALTAVILADALL